MPALEKYNREEGMEGKKIEGALRRKLLDFQRNEITEHHVYRGLARMSTGENRKVFQKLSEEELGHYRTLAEYTGEEVSPARWKARWYLLLARIFGVTFAMKLMEEGERRAEAAYMEVAAEIPELRHIVHEEEAHEEALMAGIDEERLGYLSSMVLGINDALVELLGALAGLTLALRQSRLVGLVTLITGIAAAMSMAASEYLSTKSEGGAKSPLRAAVYTGAAYIVTVALLVFPFFVLGNVYFAMGLCLFDGLLVVGVFTFFMAVVRGLPYRKTLFEMVAIGLGVAGASFLIGWLMRTLLGVEV